MIHWIQSNKVLLAWLFAASVLMFVAILVLVPLVIIYLPADYFAAPKRDRRRRPRRHPAVHTAWLIGKNALGGILVLLGLIMLAAPGQGALTIVIGLTLMDFPGKYRLTRSVIQRRPVLASLNALRAKFKRPPLTFGRGPAAPGDRQAAPGGSAD